MKINYQREFTTVKTSIINLLVLRNFFERDKRQNELSVKLNKQIKSFLKMSSLRSH